MTIAQCIRMVVHGLVLGLCSASICLATPGQLPLGYRISGGAYPWTGRLHALAFRTASLSSSAVLTQWEAGERLDKADASSRRLYLGGTRIDPLRWDAIDDDAKAVLDGIEPAGHGPARLAWLRGHRSDPALRPRDTRLASAAGALVHLVPPPTWLPMQPGHTHFRLRHAARAVTVWLGTRDGFLHGFDAVTGDERTAYLPRAMFAGAASMTSPTGPVPRVPCPRPESLDADPAGTWRTLLLCGIPARDTPGAAQTGAVFALDISDPDAAAGPFGLLWEISATDALPLSGNGPIRAAMWIEHGVRRWAAVATLAPNAAANVRAGLALLPLDRSAQTWATSGRVARIGLPESGCDAPASSARLLAASVNSDAGGQARAAYVVDDRGRLWRFGLEHLSSAGSPSPAACMHRHQAMAGEQAEAPIIIRTGAGPLVIYGAGNELSAIPDRPEHTTPTRIDAMADGDGVRLRATQANPGSSENGWTLRLPHAGERIETLQSASPVHLSFTTIAPDGRQRSYLVDASTGESVATVDANGIAVPAITGLAFDAGAAPVVVTAATSNGQPTSAGQSSRDRFDLGLWQIDGNTAHLMQQATWYRRRGRLGWRELVRTPS